LELAKLWGGGFGAWWEKKKKKQAGEGKESGRGKAALRRRL